MFFKKICIPNEQLIPVGLWEAKAVPCTVFLALDAPTHRICCGWWVGRLGRVAKEREGEASQLTSSGKPGKPPPPSDSGALVWVGGTTRLQHLRGKQRL